MTPDVNVLVAASRRDHPHHGRAVAWLDDALDATGRGDRFALLPMVAVGFLRLVTNRRVFVHPTPIGAARAFVCAILDAPGVEMGEVGAEWSRVERLCVEQGLIGNDIPDAWIAAAVMYRSDHLVTFDRGFRRWLPAGQLTVLEP
ncbi:MAG: PIN domain-containing protein [Deltaproteobacteria bacterium]|nr:PIN domain-containing protein [Deltaproteobacteria bacterium]